MNTKLALACMATLSLGVSTVTGCAGDRPLRNGVPNENLFLRKAFIIRPGEGSTPDKPVEDDGWMLKATILETSTPNPLASNVLFTGAENNGMLVRFIATQNKLQMVNLREISNLDIVKTQGTRTPEVVDAWDAEHGDLKLAVTADGEKTNRFEMNQELGWQTRQWVKVNLSKTDMSDFSLFGSMTSQMLGKCVAGGSSVTTVPDSIVVDEKNNYIEWKTSVTLTPKFDDAACVEGYGEAGSNFQRHGRSNVTAIVKYSMVRATPTPKVTYKTLELPEKDPIRRKYGPIFETSWARDPDSGQLAAREFAIRFDPEKPLVFYFAKGYPDEKKTFWTTPGGIVDQTNAVFEKAGAKIRLSVKNFDEDVPADADNLTKERGREYGDIRYNFIRWMSDIDISAPFIGVAQFVPDPRTGEALSASVNIADFPLKEFVAQRVDAFLQTIMCRASNYNTEYAATVCDDLNSDKPWGPPAKGVKDKDGNFKFEPYPEQCTPGQIAEIVPKVLEDTYAKSSLYSKMQEYLGEPAAVYGPLGPRDFIPDHNAVEAADFEQAFYKLLPYYIFADPASNPFVTPVGNGGEFGSDEQYKSLQKMVEFHSMTADLDQGKWPFDVNGGVDGVNTFLNKLQQGQLDHRDHVYKQAFMHNKARQMDAAGDLVSFTGVMEKAGRHCVNGHWETKEEWLDKVIQTYHALTVWHEFGHTLGMAHNFMGSIDKPNYPHYKAPGCDPATDTLKCDRIGMYSSSVMEYSTTPDRIFWANESGDHGWGSYDRGAIAFLYGNEGTLSPEVRAQAAAEAASKGVDVSGQVSPILPYKDPEGFRADGTEIQFLYCNENHLRFTPFCRTFDFGSSPSEIIANEIEAYEWQYAWRNFRKYRKVWDLHNYADAPNKEIIELRRFLPIWRSDWQDTSLRDDFGRFKIQPIGGWGANANSKELYYKQLATKFDDELSQTNQMVAAFHLAVIQQSSGERPYATIIDKFNGDVTQQGITLDKSFAMTGWVGLWPSDNYDPNQRGTWVSSFGGSSETRDNNDIEYSSIAERAVANMIGEERFDAYPYMAISAVVLFARDTHNPNFNGKKQLKDWVGGNLFTRTEDVERYFREQMIKKREVAVMYPDMHCDTGDIKTCDYDPRQRRPQGSKVEHLSDDFNEFLGPDGLHYAWIEFRDRRQWIFVTKELNLATYKLVREYNEQLKAGLADERLFSYSLPIKYAIDAYLKYETFTPGK